MYIVTKNKSVIPLSNIHAVRTASKGGSIIMLKTGEKIPDPREAEDVLKQAYCAEPDLTPIIEAISFIAESLQKHKRATKQTLNDTTVLMNTKLQELNTVTKDGLTTLKNTTKVAADKVTDSTAKLSVATELTTTAATQCASITESTAKLAEQLNDAISEI